MEADLKKLVKAFRRSKRYDPNQVAEESERWHRAVSAVLQLRRQRVKHKIMCGRYSIVPRKETKGKSRAAKLIAEYLQEGRFNAAPSQSLPVVTDKQPEALQFFSWGLQPFWAKDAKAVKRSINAMAETLTEKPTVPQPAEVEAVPGAGRRLL